MANESVKFGILAAKKKKKTTILQELNLDFADSNGEIMINQQLVPYFGNLLYKARQLRLKGAIYQCWFTMKGVHIKPTENGNAVIIKSPLELVQFNSNAIDEEDTTRNNNNKRKASKEINSIAKKTNDKIEEDLQSSDTPTGRPKSQRSHSSRNNALKINQPSTEKTTTTKTKSGAQQSNNTALNQANK